jgi:hypothetical protein
VLPAHAQSSGHGSVRRCAGRFEYINGSWDLIFTFWRYFFSNEETIDYAITAGTKPAIIANSLDSMRWYTGGHDGYGEYHRFYEWDIIYDGSTVYPEFTIRFTLPTTVKTYHFASFSTSLTIGTPV